MAVRGGAMSHAIARAGWLVFGALGALVMVGVAVLYAANPGERGADNSTGANFVGGLVVMMPIGALFGGLLGLLGQFAARSWLRTPTPAERLAARAAEANTARVAVPGLRSSGRWARSYETCANSVAAFHAVVATVPAGAARDWFANISATLDDELAEALRLAQLGESLEDGDPTTSSPTAQKVTNLLQTAERSFAETTEQAATIALNLRHDSDFIHVRSQLDMLATQTPHLRTEGIT
jgi:hypothetical protein